MKKINKKNIKIIGIIIMSIIGGGRSVEVENNQNIISRGIENVFNNNEFYYSLTLDFAVNSYTLYRGLEYVSNNGINYGATMIKDLVAVFPFLQSFLEKSLSIKFQTSSEFFTEEILGKEATWGLGTNLIADIYIAYGILGSIFIFIIFGAFIENIRRHFYESNSMQSGIVYITLMGYSVYLPRASIFMPLKVIVWSLIIYYILRSVNFLKYRYF